jgi:hypothetical protein
MVEWVLTHWISLLPPKCRILNFIPCYMNAVMDAFDLSVLLNRIALHHARAFARLHTSRMALSRHGLE